MTTNCFGMKLNSCLDDINYKIKQPRCAEPYNKLFNNLVCSLFLLIFFYSLYCFLNRDLSLSVFTKTSEKYTFTHRPHIYILNNR